MKEFNELLELIADNRKKILFAGIGNVLRCDDGAGVYIVNNLMENTNITKILVEVSLENYVSRINNAKPDLLVLVDCIDFGREPGYAGLLLPEDTFETTINTHNLTLRRVTEFFNMPVCILGIQPSRLEVGEEMTPGVKKSADNIIRLLNQTIYQTVIQNHMPFQTQSKLPNTYAYDNC
ncbi:MAG: hydrogenase maturation protease [Bacteroidales bacterium]|nr:hydrogenase maturation protease [Bacteroidales bacterium]